METLKIPTTSGDTDVAVHREKHCKNLCVTMAHFGHFEVTHIESGRKLLGGFERAASAVRECLLIELCLVEIGVNEPISMNDITMTIKSSKTTFERLGCVNMLDYIRARSRLDVITSEFPWEDYDDSPFAVVDKLRVEIDDKQ